MRNWFQLLAAYREPSKKIETKDDVRSPVHYTSSRIQLIEVIEDWKLPAHLANVVKYIKRAPEKGTLLKDLKKAAWYLNRFIEYIEERERGYETLRRM